MKHDLWEKLPPQLYLQLKRWDYRLKEKEAFAQTQQQREMTTADGHSFKPFDDHRAILVQIPQVGSEPVSRALFGNRSGGHTTLEHYLNIFEPRCITEYFKFTFVRNPWDRLVSAYLALQQGQAEDVDSAWYDEDMRGYESFDEFVRKGLTRRLIWRWRGFAPQYHFMLDRREMIRLDFVGFVENMQDDFAHVAEQLGIDAGGGAPETSASVAYTEFYTEQTRDIVADVYAEDIRLLGYSFDNSNLPQQIASRALPKIYTLRSGID